MDKRILIKSVILSVIASSSTLADGFAQEGYIVEKIKHNFEILVEPQRSEIYSGEQTAITIDVHEFDTAGLKIQALSAAVVINITGLIDGQVTPASGSKIITDHLGFARLDYKAGEKDKEISVMATFIPEGSAIEYVDEATITVKPLEYEATLTIRGSYNRIESSSYRNQTSDGVEDGTFNLQENREASFYIPLKMENAGDMPILNQRWEYYRPLDISLSKFNASFRSRQYDHGQHGGYGFRTTILKTKSPVNEKVAAKDYLLQSNIILIIDKKTDKVVKIATGGFPVGFKWSGSEAMQTEGWTPDSRSADSKTDPINEEDQFDASPVEDPVPDPTVKGISESLKKYFKDLGTPLPATVEIPEDNEAKAETEPDLLVKFGDGVSFFGGSGKKIIDNSEASSINRSEMTFDWSVTRKKKQL